jgi:hypothetical protein
MRPLWLAILVFASSATSFSKPTAPTPVDRAIHVPATRLVVGSLADVSVDQADGGPVTFLHVLEFTSNWTAQAPALLGVRLCGDYSRDLAASVHTNISIVYRLASSSRSTGCLSLVRVQPWHDDSPWQTIVIDSLRVKPSPKLQETIRDLALPEDRSSE